MEVNDLSHGGDSIAVLAVVNPDLDVSSPQGKKSLLLVQST